MSKSLTESLTNEILRVTEIKVNLKKGHFDELRAELMAASLKFAFKAKSNNDVIAMQVSLDDLRDY